MQLYLQKTIWLLRFLSQYTKLHTVTPPYPQYATYVPNRSPQISNQLLTTLTNGSYLKHIIIIQSHYTTVDRNIKQAYSQS